MSHLCQSINRTMKARTKSYIEDHASQAVLLIGAIIGGGSFAYYYLHGLSTVHFDAKAHLVVARRIMDAAVPGYAQMGAHWLPLIHLLYLPLVAVDSQYYSAFLPCLISVLGFVLSAWLVFRISMRLTGSAMAGLFAAAMLLANQNMQFLQSAPLTEPVYMALALLAMDALLRWRDAGGKSLPWSAATWAALAAFCRYEGWLFLGGTCFVITCDWLGHRISRAQAAKSLAVFATLFLVPIGAHFGYIYARLGDTFFQRMARGNPAPFETYKRPFLSVWYHFGEVAQAAGLIALLLGMGGLIYGLMERQKLLQRLPYLLLWLPTLANIAALHWGLMYRVRYSALLLPAVAVFGSLLLAGEKTASKAAVLGSFTVFLLPWISWSLPSRWEYHFVYPGPGVILLPAAALVLLLAAIASGRYRCALFALVVAGLQIPVFEGEIRPMLAESLEHQYIVAEQQQVVEYLSRHYDGRRVLIDVGRLAPLMYDSRLPLKEFVYHDGDTTDWDKASLAPRGQVGWLCAEKGDEIWGLLHVDPHWADGYSLAVQTENYVLYQLNGIRR
jgi:hypothetical protein